MRIVFFCLVAAAAFGVAGCEGSQGQQSADCSAQVRLGSRVYTEYGHTDRAATSFGVADEAVCHDVGEDAEGSVFTDDPRQATVWSFEGFAPEHVLGVRFDEDTFSVFVAKSVPRTDIDRIVNELNHRCSPHPECL